MNTFFTSDTHAWHENIIKYCDRPFTDAAQMTHQLADNINNVVSKHDRLYHLGDFAWGNVSMIEEFRGMINCQNITLVFGNHDRRIRQCRSLWNLFKQVKDQLEVKVHKQRIILNHCSMRVWPASHRGSWHLYGHSHGTLPPIPGMPNMDVGVDCWDYKPISFEEVSHEIF